MNPPPKREDIVRLCRVSLAFAQAIEGARKALERNGMDPAQFGLEQAIEAARALRETERVTRNAEKQRLWREYTERNARSTASVPALQSAQQPLS